MAGAKKQPGTWKICLKGWSDSDGAVGWEAEGDDRNETCRRGENPHTYMRNVGANISFGLALTQQLIPGREGIGLLSYASSPAQPPTPIGGAIPPHYLTGVFGLV